MESVLIRARQVLTITPARWLELTCAISPELLSLPPAAQEWSALQCLEHLIETERDVFPARLHAYLAGQDFPPFDPDSQKSRPTAHQSPVALAQEFDRLRQDSLAQLMQFSEADQSRRARHTTLGIVTLSETMNTWAAHDLNHTVQAERALMQPFIRDCGPFQFRFADHVAKARAA